MLLGTKIIASVLALGVVGGGVAGAQSVKPAHTVNHEKVEKGEKQEKQDANEQAKLQKEASITKDQATKTVLEQYPGGTVKEVELEDEDGAVVYGVHVTAKDGKSYDVKVNAKTGKVLKSESDDDNENESDNE